MKKPFSCVLRFCRNLRDRRAQRKASRANMQHLSDLAFRERTLNQLEQTGLLAWNAQHRQLFIAQSLAALFLRDADTWTAFIHNVHQWLYLRLCTDTWEQFMQHEELAAVRRAMQRPAPDPSLSGRGVDTPEQQNISRPSIQGGDGGGSPLSRSDIDRIKWSRRREIAMSDMEPPKVEPFEFVIIQESDKPVEPLAVGHYDPATDQMEVALWQDVKQYLQTDKDHQ